MNTTLRPAAPKAAAPRPAAPKVAASNAVAPSAATIDALAKMIQARSGIALDASKLYLLESRLEPIMRRNGCADLNALASRIRTASDALAGEIVDAMTTNETLFFRDDKPFRHFREVVLPALHAARPAGQRLRVWSAACSSGQELYSLAITLAEARPIIGTRQFELLGTDISPTQVARARSGTYTHFEIQRGLPVQMLVKHFDRSDAGWQIKAPLRDAASFRNWNLLDDPAPLGRFDVVFCRNVLIYFDQPTKARVLSGIARQMAPDGVLYMGGSETVLGLNTPFQGTPGEPAFRLKK